MKLFLLLLQNFLLGGAALGLCLFLPAWTLDYWQGWVFIGVFLASGNAIGLWLWFRDPELLERRKRVGPAAEQRPVQKAIIRLIVVACVAMPVVGGLDRRLGWSHVPALVSGVGDALVVLGLYIDWLVLRVNRFAGSTIETAPDQKVISTGPYAVVRHPMYAGSLVMLAGVPLALGSWWAFVLVGLSLLLLVWRIFDEERFLEQQLPGYLTYEGKVRYRLVPYVW